jgi:hypothetical protein
MVPRVTRKYGFNMGSIRTLLSILRVYGTLRFTQIRHHHLYNPALCGPLVGRRGLRILARSGAEAGSFIRKLLAEIVTSEIKRLMGI